MRSFWLGTCLLAGIRLCAQQTVVANYDVDQGLPQSMVNHIVQDPEGFIWFGTGDGLARFDGSRFTVYKHDPADSTSLGHNSIWGLAAAGDSGLWVGTRRGLDLLMRGTRRFKHVRTGPPGAGDGCWTPQWSTNDEVLFHSPLLKEFLLLRNGHPQRFPTHHQGAYAIAPTLAGAPLRFFAPPDSLITFSLERGDVNVQLLPVRSGDRVTDIEPVGDRWLILTEQDGFLWKQGTGRMPLPSDLARKLRVAQGNKYAARDPAGNLWLAISHAGVYRLNGQLEIAAEYHLGNTERPAAFTLITFDHQGNTWVGTDGQGAFRIAPQRTKFGRCMPGLSEEWSPSNWFVRGFAQWDPHRVLVWFHASGPALFDERNSSLLPLQLAGPASAWRSVDRVLQDSDGIIWLVNREAIVAIDPKDGGTVRKLDVPKGSLLLIGPKGRALAFTFKALLQCRMRNGAITKEAIPAPGLFDWMRRSHRGPQRLFMDQQDRLWAQAQDAPVLVWRKGVLQPDSVDGLGKDVVMTSLVHGPGDTLWASTTNGLYAWRASDLKLLHHITVHDGLADGHMYGILHSPHGPIWATSNNGLARYDPATGTIRNFGTQDGLQSREFNTDALFTSASGLWYIGGINGFNYFRPEDVRPDPDVPQVAIVGVTAQDQPWTTGPDSTLVLPYRTNMVEITVAVLEQSAPELNSYRYRLAGFSETWHTAPASHPILFTRLPAGRYQLEVAGINADGIASTPVDLLRIHVPLPFWASNWFFAMLALAGAVLTAWLLSWRARQRMQRQLARTELELKELRMRNRLAKEIHDDVGSGLARIAALSRSPKRNADAEARFDKLGTISSELMENLRDVVWMNDPHKGTLDALLLRITEHAKDLFEDSGATVACEWPDGMADNPIGGTFRRNLFLIAKEALQNARKYSEAQQISIRWRLGPEDFTFEVTDDGTGALEGEVQGTGHGSVNMRQRAEEMGALYQRHSTPGGGTTILVSGPASCLDS